VKKRIAAEKKEKLKQEKEAARLKKEAAEKAAREAADVVSCGWEQRESFVLTLIVYRTTLPTSTASSPSSSRPRGLVSRFPVLESNDLSR
jgi:hypothetical protein